MLQLHRLPLPCLALTALAATAAPAQQRPVFEYAVKFVCGRSGAATPAAPTVLAPGTYFTAINVHNSGDQPTKFRKKFALAFPAERAGPVSRFFDARLGADSAFEIDCADIRQAFPPRPVRPLIKGFAVLQLFDSTAALDVVAVYTAAGSSGRVETMDVERVPARRLTAGPPPGLPDLVPDTSCVRDTLGLHVTVRNIGTAPSGPSITTVNFVGFGTVSLPTPPIAAGGSVTMTVPIPPGCFNPDCEFVITADATSLVAESNEGNNTVKGVCIG